MEALGWGALAASSLLVGAALALVRDWSNRSIGLVLGFGAGALISAVSFELAEEGLKVGGELALAAGLAAGALTYFVLDRLVERLGSGWDLTLGAFLDGIPEQLVLGIGIATGEGVSVGLLVAIFVSNVPESTGATSEMEGSRARKLGLWLGVAVCCTLATVAGYALADSVGGGNGQAAVNGFAAGALLVMLTDSMIPDAKGKAGNPAGLVTVLGFAVAAFLSLS